MPRLPNSLIRHARHQHPLLPFLLRPCRDLNSARNELRWLRERALEVASSSTARLTWRSILRQLCLERSSGKPLQYILGTQPFGDLEILCKPGVLIPRPETEAITTHFASLLQSASAPKPSNHQHGVTGAKSAYKQAPLHILDLCTGTGCIPLLLYALLSRSYRNLHISGIDISPQSIRLSQKNLTHNTRNGSLSTPASDQISFHQFNIFSNTHTAPWTHQHPWDILISNPPYISPSAFQTTTSRSVRNHEPREALVPHSAPSTPKFSPIDPDIDPGDLFYPRLLHIAQTIHAKVLLMEVADLEQATRVVEMVLATKNWAGCQIWRDEPGAGTQGEQVVLVGGRGVGVVGEGNGRAVLAWRGGGGEMLGVLG